MYFLFFSSSFEASLIALVLKLTYENAYEVKTDQFLPFG